MSDARDVRYAERGASWWPLLWGPSFALLGFVVELATPGPLHLPQWLVLAVLLTAAAALWVGGRRRFRSVRLTSTELSLGGEAVPLDRLALPAGDQPAHTGRVLGVGGPATGVPGVGGTVPKGTTAVPLLYRPEGDESPDGEETAVLAWAENPEALRAELVALLRSE